MENEKVFYSNFGSRAVISNPKPKLRITIKKIYTDVHENQISKFKSEVNVGQSLEVFQDNNLGKQKLYIFNFLEYDKIRINDVIANENRNISLWSCHCTRGSYILANFAQCIGVNVSVLVKLNS